MKDNRIVIVGGGGHVGLPLSLALANVGFSVTAYDISIDVVKMLNQGKVPFIEKGAEDLLLKVLNDKSFTASETPSSIFS